jgi:hypothetical protein
MYYYIVETGESLIKVGITKNLEQRLRSYRTANTQLVYHKTYALNCDRREAGRIERTIMSELRRWYTCRSETVESGSLLRVERIVDGLMEELLV